MKIGIDIDGVLADFQPAYRAALIKATGKDLYPDADYNACYPCWQHPQHWGYTNADNKAAWAIIADNEFFWEHLEGYPNTEEALFNIHQNIAMRYWEVYFITDRPGKWPKIQTERWLRGKNTLNMTNRDEFRPTVLVTGEKGQMANALKLDSYIDDKWENCLDVWNASGQTHVWMLERPWNAGWRQDAVRKGITPVKSLTDMLKGVQ